MTESSGSRSVSGSHWYPIAGIYTISVTAADNRKKDPEHQLRQPILLSAIHTVGSGPVAAD